MLNSVNEINSIVRVQGRFRMVLMVRWSNGCEGGDTDETSPERWTHASSDITTCGFLCKDL